MLRLNHRHAADARGDAETGWACSGPTRPASPNGRPPGRRTWSTSRLRVGDGCPPADRRRAVGTARLHGTGAIVDSTFFDGTFPYLKVPIPGSPSGKVRQEVRATDMQRNTLMLVLALCGIVARRLQRREPPRLDDELHAVRDGHRGDDLGQRPSRPPSTTRPSRSPKTRTPSTGSSNRTRNHENAAAGSQSPAALIALAAGGAPGPTISGSSRRASIPRSARRVSFRPQGRASTLSGDSVARKPRENRALRGARSGRQGRERARPRRPCAGGALWRPHANGLHLVGYRSSTTSIELEAAKFESYLAEGRPHERDRGPRKVAWREAG